MDIPDSMDECVYFTRRKFPGEKGSVICWARRLQCPKCKKGRLSKPVDAKTGSYKTRASEYVCSSCGYSEPKAEHEQKLTAEILYTCPFCQTKGEATAPFARKSFYGKKAIVFNCSKCNEKIGVTKKLAMPEDFLAKLEGRPAKKKAAKDDADDDDDF